MPLHLFSRRRPAAPSNAAGLRESIERRFFYRGTSTLEIERVTVAGEIGDVTFFGRPVFPNDRRAGHRARQEVFAEQLFEDTVAIAETVFRHNADIQYVCLTALLKRVGDDAAIPVLSTEIARQFAEPLLRRDIAPSRRTPSPLEVLRRFPTRCRVDRHGNFHEERDLT